MYKAAAAAGLGTIATVAWYMRIPIPDKFSKPGQLRMMQATSRIQGAYDKILDALGVRTLSNSYRARATELAQRRPKADTEGLELTDTMFDGIPVRIYRPVDLCSEPQGCPALVYYHGGGWTRGDADYFKPLMARTAKALGNIVIYVEYRLAPEVVFPVPFEDCLTATKYFLQHAREFGADPSRVAVGGDSAGGNLAAAVAMKLRDESFSPMPRNQILIYPALQAMDYNTPSMIQNKNGPFLTRDMMGWFWSMYISGTDRYMSSFLSNSHTSKEVKQALAKSVLNHEDLGEEFIYKPYMKPRLDFGNQALWDDLKDTLQSPYLAPLMAEDLSGLPEAYIFTAQCDVLRDDGILFAKRLRDAGVKVTHKHLDTGFHGMAGWVGIFDEGTEFFDGLVTYVKSNL